MENVFHAMEGHKGLRVVALHDYPLEYCRMSGEEEEAAYDYTSLERLLSFNRNIEICNHRGDLFSNRSRIDKFYALNRFYNGSETLLRKTASLRPMFVALALKESASANYQYTGLLLSNHMDVLCECMQNVDSLVTAEPVTDDEVSASLSQTNDRAKRKASFQTLAVKKVPRNDT